MWDGERETRAESPIVEGESDGAEVVVNEVEYDVAKMANDGVGNVDMGEMQSSESNEA